MAFSMFLRSPACTNKLLGQQMMKFATQASIVQRSVASPTPIHNIFSNDNKTTTPLMNAVRSFRTSATMKSAETPHDHAKLWVIEKVVSAALVPLIPLAVMLPCKLLDATIAILITAHTFWGLEAIAVDYARASVFGPVIPKIALGSVYLLCIATLGGLFYIISHDVGIGNTVRNIWAIKSQKA